MASRHDAHRQLVTGNGLTKGWCTTLNTQDERLADWQHEDKSRFKRRITSSKHRCSFITYQFRLTLLLPRHVAFASGWSSVRTTDRLCQLRPHCLSSHPIFWGNPYWGIQERGAVCRRFSWRSPPFFSCSPLSPHSWDAEQTTSRLVCSRMRRQPLIL